MMTTSDQTTPEPVRVRDEKRSSKFDRLLERLKSRRSTGSVIGAVFGATVLDLIANLTNRDVSGLFLTFVLAGGALGDRIGQLLKSDSDEIFGLSKRGFQTLLASFLIGVFALDVSYQN